MKTSTDGSGKVKYDLEVGDKCPHCKKQILIQHGHVSDQLDCRNCGTVGSREAKENEGN